MALHIERDGSIAVLRIDNPQTRGSLDLATAASLVQACGELRGDLSVRAVVVTGTGRDFCSGADLGSVRQAAQGVLARRELLRGYYRAFLDVRDLPQPVVGAVTGPAIGAGLNLALCCDLRVAGRSARLGATFVRLGIAPGGGATGLLRQLVGPAVAADLLLTGRVVAAEEAMRVGLVNEVVDDGDVLSRALEIARACAAGAPRVVRIVKRTLRLAADAEVAQALEIESLAQAASQDDEDAAEGWAAFRERREPRFADR